MQLLGIVIVMAGVFVGYTFTVELTEYETRRRRIRRQQTLLRREHPSVQHYQIRLMSTRLFDQDAS